MGQQQILLLTLSFILVAGAVTLGIKYFDADDNAANKDAIVLDLNALGQDAFQYSIKLSSMAGGGGSFVGYTISPQSSWGGVNPNAVYSISSVTSTQIVLMGRSKVVPAAIITETFDKTGQPVGPPVESGF